MSLDLVLVVPAVWNLANQDKRRLELRLKVWYGRVELVETLAARQGDGIGVVDDVRPDALSIRTRQEKVEDRR